MPEPEEAEEPTPPSVPPDDPEPEPKKELSEEEQMAQYEESLKEEDWGHQPC